MSAANRSFVCVVSNRAHLPFEINHHMKFDSLNKTLDIFPQMRVSYSPLIFLKCRNLSLPASEDRLQVGESGSSDGVRLWGIQTKPNQPLGGDGKPRGSYSALATAPDSRVAMDGDRGLFHRTQWIAEVWSLLIFATITGTGLLRLIAPLAARGVAGVHLWEASRFRVQG